MFEGFRQHSQSLFLLLLVVSVAMIFGSSWGPGAQGCQQGKISVTYVAKVHGRTLPEADLVAAQRFLPQLVPQYLEENPAVTQAIRQGALDGLIERELLAHEAERVGFRVDDDQTNEELRNCRLYFSVGMAHEPTLNVRSGAHQLPTQWCNGQGSEFDYESFQRTIRRLMGRTVADYRAVMQREMLAQRMRESVVSSVVVSDEEMWRDYRRTHDRTAVRYLRFSLPFYRDLARDDDAAVTAWAAQHQDEINRQWERRRESLRGLARQVRLRNILVKFPSEHATDEEKAQTRAKADAIARQLARGEDFVRLARLYSEDEGTWRTGGEAGWRDTTGERVNVPEVIRAATALQVNGVSAPVETAQGFYIVQLLGTREGDVAEADAKREIARTLYREARAAELAQQAARQALERISGGAAIDVVARELHDAALREFYRGTVPEPQALPNGVRLAALERTDLDAPELKESEQFARDESPVRDLENASALTAAAFSLTEQAPLVTEPLRVGDDWFILRFKEGSRTVATREEFNRQRAELLSTTYASMLDARRREALVAYVAELRQRAEHDGDVRIGNSPRLRPPSQNPNAQDEE